jgi:hypothetical protein
MPKFVNRKFRPETGTPIIKIVAYKIVDYKWKRWPQPEKETGGQARDAGYMETGS